MFTCQRIWRITWTCIFRQNLHDSNFNKSNSFCNIVCGKDTSIGAAIFILTLNHADVIGDQSDTVTQNAWFRCALCAAISGEISILLQTGAESWGRFPVPRICRWESKHCHTRVISEKVDNLLIFLELKFLMPGLYISLDS